MNSLRAVLISILLPVLVVVLIIFLAWTYQMLEADDDTRAARSSVSSGKMTTFTLPFGDGAESEGAEDPVDPLESEDARIDPAQGPNQGAEASGPSSRTKRDDESEDGLGAGNS